MRRPPTNASSQSAACYHGSLSGQSDNNLLKFIATEVETMRHRIDTMSDQMATKVDFADLKEEMSTLKDQMVTKADLARVESSLREQKATKDDLTRLATTVRGDFEQVHFRFATLEGVITTRLGQLETDISRLRSVLYLLVKDKPDMLRLLGQPTPGEGRP